MIPADEDSAIRDGAAIGTLAPRRQIAVAGRDRASYLQGMLTNDISALSPGTGCYSAWLTVQGRMLTDMHVLESGELILLDVPAETLQATVERLEQFIFTEDVRVESLADSLTGVWLHGRQAPAVLERVFGSSGAAGLAAWPAYRHARFDFQGHPVSLARIDQLGVPGFCVYVERSGAERLTRVLIDAGARHVSAATIESARVEAGYPVFGIDMTDDTIPLEAGIEDRAISLSKGCYVGQEVIIRVLHRGHGRVVRKLVSLRLENVVPPGSRLFAADRDVGFVTSAAASPRLGPIAMGYAHRDFVAAGTVLEARPKASEAGSKGVTATVIERAVTSKG